MISIPGPYIREIDSRGLLGVGLDRAWIARDVFPRPATVYRPDVHEGPTVTVVWDCRPDRPVIVGVLPTAQVLGRADFWLTAGL